MVLIEARLAPPAEPARLQARPRLQLLLEKVRRARLTLVHAPAGYGKSSLLGQWHAALNAEGYCAGWVGLGASNNDPAGTLSHVATALARADDRLAGIATSLQESTQDPTSPLMLQAIVDALGECPEPMFLFIDDLHVAEPGTLATLRRLIELAPPAFHCILASRSVPDVPLARVRANGDLLELGVAELMFTSEETRQFLRGTNHCRTTAGRRRCVDRAHRRMDCRHQTREHGVPTRRKHTEVFLVLHGNETYGCRLQIHLLGGEMRAAQRTLRDAVALAAESRLIRSFVDEGAIIQTLLDNSTDVEQRPNHPTNWRQHSLLAMP